MRQSLCLVVWAGILLPATVALAQRPVASDPFGGSPKPAKPADDPFGGGSDPFAATPPTKRPAAAAPTKPDVKPSGAVVPRISDATRRVRAALSDETQFTFVDLPLFEALREISQMHQIPVFADGRALEELGLSTDVPVTISVKKISLRSALNLMLRDLDLTYMVRNEVLTVTSREAAEQNLAVETYLFPESLADRSEKIVSVLTATVEPDQWAQLGGPCNVATIENVLVVSAPETVHEQVVEFLIKLQEAFEKRTAKQ